jgi:hypothetical protein
MSPVTAESSQPAPQPAAPAQSAQPQSSNNQSVRIAALVVLGLVLVGVVGWLIFGHDSKKGNPNVVVVPYIKPVGYNAQNLAAESAYINTRFYWAGAKKNTIYEFRRTTNGYLYVRYLPKGTPIGKHGAFLTIATYHFRGAKGGGYSALKNEAGAHALQGPNGSIIFVRPKDPHSVLMAFPGGNDQIEIFAPRPVDAVKTARSGNIAPVRSSSSG